MRNKQLLIKEIVEANAFKSAYRYYLASGRALHEVENTTQVQHNLKTVNATLRRLYREFEDLKLKRPIDERREIIDRKVGSDQRSVGRAGSLEPQTLNQKQQCSLQTAEAIKLFNTDARFSIRE
jgi:hypothetical protein